jgi:putative transposase
VSHGRRRSHLDDCGPFQDGHGASPPQALDSPLPRNRVRATAETIVALFKMARRTRQLRLRIRTWGGKRAGAGRPRLKNRQSSVPHRPRPEHNARHPVHITLRARQDTPSFRTPAAVDALTAAMPAATSPTFRIVVFSVQADHVHAIVEAADKRALSLGVAGLRIRSAKSLNRALNREGSVWSGKYHARALRTPRETRAAIVYVLQNWKKHVRGASGIDPCSSGPWFDGWREAQPCPSAPSPVARPRTWLAQRGWRDRGGGAIAIAERPAAGR